MKPPHVRSTTCQKAVSLTGTALVNAAAYLTAMYLVGGSLRAVPVTAGNEMQKSPNGKKDTRLSPSPMATPRMVAPSLFL